MIWPAIPLVLVVQSTDLASLYSKISRYWRSNEGRCRLVGRAFVFFFWKKVTTYLEEWYSISPHSSSAHWCRRLPHRSSHAQMVSLAVRPGLQTSFSIFSCPCPVVHIMFVYSSVQRKNTLIGESYFAYRKAGSVLHLSALLHKIQSFCRRPRPSKIVSTVVCRHAFHWFSKCAIPSIEECQVLQKNGESMRSVLRAPLFFNFLYLAHN